MTDMALAPGQGAKDFDGADEAKTFIESVASWMLTVLQALSERPDIKQFLRNVHAADNAAFEGDRAVFDTLHEVLTFYHNIDKSLNMSRTDAQPKDELKNRVSLIFEAYTLTVETRLKYKLRR